jgi:general nucleoside transport system permease protein
VNGVEQTLIGGVSGGTAILLPALGELIGERAGVINLGTEGAMLAGALGAYAMTQSSGVIWYGIIAGVLAGAAVGLAHSWITIRRGGDQIASGLLLWFLALGVTSVFGTAYVGTAITPLPNIAIPGLNSIPWVGVILFDQNILVYAGYVLVAVIWFVFYRTRVGLILRATGERPEVVAATGGKPQLVQIVAVTIGACLGGLGGAQLSHRLCRQLVQQYDQRLRVRFGRGRALCGLAPGAGARRGIPVRHRARRRIGTAGHGVSVNQYLLDALPYLVTLLVLAVFARRGRSETPEELTRSLSRSG